MSRLAIQERLLPGSDVSERLTAANALGISFVEFDIQNLDERLPAIAEAMEQTGVMASGIHMGRVDGWLSADRAKREAASDMLREALTCAMDLEADYVTFAPQWGKSDLPDLTPIASPMDLQKQLLIWLLRGMSDLADTMEAALALLPLNRGETDFLTRLEQAAWFRRQVDDHPRIRLAANTYHEALEEANLVSSLRTHLPDIGVLYLTDTDHQLPGAGKLPFDRIGDLLNEAGYAGWLALEAEGASATELESCLRHLRACGIS